MLKISERHPTHTIIDMNCPQCGEIASFTLTNFINSINLGLWLLCSHCNGQIIVKVGLLDTQRSLTLREADSQALKLLRDLKRGVPQKGTVYYENLIHRIDAILESA